MDTASSTSLAMHLYGKREYTTNVQGEKNTSRRHNSELGENPSSYSQNHTKVLDIVSIPLVQCRIQTPVVRSVWRTGATLLQIPGRFRFASPSRESANQLLLERYTRQRGLDSYLSMITSLVRKYNILTPIILHFLYETSERHLLDLL